jgi:uncharacterized protein YodC (DUF2158 family)
MNQRHLFILPKEKTLIVTSMAQQRFKTGDEVQHKSGGPKMVVRVYEPKDGEEVICEWMNKEHMPVEKAFHQDVIKYYQAPGLRVVSMIP